VLASSRRILSAHVGAAVWAGVVVGSLLGALASLVETRVSFLLQVANEVFVTWVYQHVSPQLAACMGIPFVFFAVHFVMGMMAALAAGAVAGGVCALLRREPGGLWAKHLGVQFGAWSFAYLLLWVLHAKFAPGVLALSATAVLLAAAALGAAAWLSARLVTRVVARAGTPGRRLARVLRAAALTGSLAVLTALLVGAARDFGRNSGAAPTGAKSYPVMIVGMDGLSWHYVETLIAEGAMPNLERLINEGVSGTLRTLLPPIESPTIWTSVATGKRPDKHGIGGFVVKTEDTHRITPVTSNLRRAAPFWNIVSDAGLAIDVVCWYVSWPAEEINGVCVSERLLFPELPDIVVPAQWDTLIGVHREAYMAARDRELARFTPHPYNPDYESQNENSRAFLDDQHLSILEYSHRKDTVAFNVARDLLRRGQPDVFAVYFEGTDRVSHRFLIHELARRHRSTMRRLYPAITDGDLEEFGDVFRRYHTQVDAWLGELLELVDERTAVIVLSDHGFGIRKPWKVHLEMNPLLEFLGYLQREPGGRVDWSRTRLCDATRKTPKLGRVTVNLAGREKDGSVAPEDLDALVAEARAALDGLRTRDGSRVFSRVRVLRDAGAPDNAGEIAVDLNEGCLADTLVFAGRALPVSAFTRTEWMPGNHRIDGIFVARGGPFRRGAHIRGAGVLDVAPTVLKIAGVPPARDMDGRPLDRAFDRELGRELERGQVDSYESSSGRVREASSSAAADSLILRQLRSLGYIR
jgi:predicted AlkP superfamily phosphohydrolase/phosphomutase